MAEIEGGEQGWRRRLPAQAKAAATEVKFGNSGSQQ